MIVKGFVLVSLSIVLSLALVYAVVDYAYDGFENGWDSSQEGWLGPWSHEGNALIIQHNNYAGDNHLSLKGPDNPSGIQRGLVRRYINVTTVPNIEEISFYARIAYFEEDDFADFRVGGQNGYSTYRRFNVTDSDNVWKFYSFDMTGFNEGNEPYIEFEALMDSKNDFVNIDEIYVR